MSKESVAVGAAVFLSRPERAAMRRQGRELVQRVKACGGCFCCTRRDRETEAWGRALCGKPKPARFMKHGCDFDPEFSRIYGRERIE